MIPAVSALRPTTITAGWPVPPSEPNECCNWCRYPFKHPPPCQAARAPRWEEDSISPRAGLGVVLTAPNQSRSRRSSPSRVFSYPSVWDLGPYPGFPLKVLTRDMGVSCCLLWALLVPATGGAGRERVID